MSKPSVNTHPTVTLTNSFACCPPQGISISFACCPPQGNSLATVLSVTILTKLTASTEVAAEGRHHKRGDAAFGRANKYIKADV